MEELISFIKNKPFVMYVLPVEHMEDFIKAFDRKQKFSISILNSESEKYTKGSIVIFSTDEDIYLCKVSNKSSTSNTHKTLNFNHFQKIAISSLDEIENLLDGRNKKLFQERRREGFSILSSKLSEKLLRILLDKDGDKIKSFLDGRIRKKSNLEILRNEAISFAMSIAEVSRNFNIDSFGYYTDYNEQELNQFKDILNISEDKIIQYDLSQEREEFHRIPSLSGKVIFKSKDSSEILSIYCANKTNVEHLAGVDLVYIDNIHKNIAMVQYKMLEKENEQWIFRHDNQIKEEIKRMKNITSCLRNEENLHENEYRINSNPFFLRFIKRKLDNSNQVSSFAIPLAHYEKLMNLDITTGSRGGKRLDFEMMNKHYLTKSGLEALIKSGYIGTYSSDTEELEKVIELLANGDNKNELVIAYKEKLNSSS